MEGVRALLVSNQRVSLRLKYLIKYSYVKDFRLKDLSLSIFRKASLLLFLMLLVFFAARCALFASYPHIFRELSGHEIAWAFFVGARFDLSSIAALMGLPICLLMVLQMLPLKPGFSAPLYLFLFLEASVIVGNFKRGCRVFWTRVSTSCNGARDDFR